MYRLLLNNGCLLMTIQYTDILRLREFDKAETSFVDSILKHEHNGRIHCEFHQLRSDDGGTVTGRFSSSNPNLQQIPARDPEIKKMIRGLFIPEEGTKWGSFDYSSQEPRLLVHFAASLKGAFKHPIVDTIVEEYHSGDVDLHQMVADIAGIKRKEEGRKPGHHVWYGQRQTCAARHLTRRSRGTLGNAP